MCRRLVSSHQAGGVLSAALRGIIATLVSWRVLFVGYGLDEAVTALTLRRLQQIQRGSWVEGHYGKRGRRTR
jgi:hypothetical protein